MAIHEICPKVPICASSQLNVKFVPAKASEAFNLDPALGRIVEDGSLEAAV